MRQPTATTSQQRHGGSSARSTRVERISQAAWRIEQTLDDRGGPIPPTEVKSILDETFADDETGWEPGDAHEACESAMTRLLLEYGQVMNWRSRSRRELDDWIRRTADIEPRVRGRSRRHDNAQHYATPLEVAWAMALLAGIEPGDTVLDPSAGTGTLLGMAHAAEPEAVLHACESDPIRADLLKRCARNEEAGPAKTPRIEVIESDTLTLRSGDSRWSEPHNTVLMNPPFTARLGSRGRHSGEDLRHLDAARRMTTGHGTIVALLGGGTKPRGDRWEKIIDGNLRLVWSARLDAGLVKKREVKISTTLCLLRNQEEDDGYDVRDAEHHTTAAELIQAVRAFTGEID